MTVNDLMKILNNVPGSTRLYISKPKSCWLFEVKNVVVHYNEKFNQVWVEFVKDKS